MVIMEGTTRLQKKWNQSKLDWLDFVARCRNPVITSETIGQYKTMSGEQKTEIKDVGGYIAGLIPDGIRQKNNILGRSMLVYDCDNMPIDTILDIPYTYLIHTTHSHTHDSPRYRLIVPLTETVTIDMFGALCRAFAQRYLQEAWIDKGSFEPSRIMFWPSHSRNAEYKVSVNDADILDGEIFCNEYYQRDWRNVRKWPFVELIDDPVDTKKLANPLTKRGIVGTFCRAYNIHEAIDRFLSHIYIVDKKNKYKLIGSDSAAGLCVYNDIYAYSHHAHDPAFGRMCNAFDLVRIHMFGQGEESYNMMASWCNIVNDPAIDAERSKDTFDNLSTIDWWHDLETSNGKIIANIRNIDRIFDNDKYFDGLRYECFTSQIKWYTSDLTSAYYDNIYAYCNKKFNLWNKGMIDTAVSVYSRQNEYNEVKQYLESLKWDGRERLETVFVDYLGADDNAYTRSVAKLVLGAAVHRIYEPGCKFDHICVFTGPQGIGKSTLLASLGRGWFCDSLTCDDMESKTGPEKLQGAWIIEIPELVGMKKAQTERIKSFISARFDTYRPAYGRIVEKHQRQCVFFGTTNESEFLRDSTGNRRFLIVPVHCLQRHITAQDVDQIWAEAVCKYKDIPLYLTDAIIKQQAEDMRIDATDSIVLGDPRTGMVEEYLSLSMPDEWYSMSVNERVGWLQLDKRTGTGTQRTRVSRQEIWVECFGQPLERMRKTDSHEITKIMQEIGGWTLLKKTIYIRGYGKIRVFERTTVEISDIDFGDF